MTPEEQINKGLDEMRRGATRQILQKYTSTEEGKLKLAKLAIGGPTFLAHGLSPEESTDLLKDAVCVFLAECSNELQRAAREEQKQRDNDIRRN